MKKEVITLIIMLTIISGCRLDLPGPNDPVQDAEDGIPASRALNAYPEAGDLYGEAVAIGDFNGDGKGDNAIGAPGKGTTSTYEDGVVQIVDYYGKKQAWYPSKILGSTTGTSLAHFGTSLAVGDFNNDGIDDLAIAAPGLFYSKGAVIVLYAKSDHSGLSSANYTLITPGSGGYQDVPGWDFGISLAVGDMNGDGVDDLAIGQAKYDNHGSVMIVQGRDNVGLGPGLAAGLGFVLYDDIVIEDSALISTYNAYTKFGIALAFGYFDNDNYADLAIGAPGNVINNRTAGSVFIVYGTSSIVLGTTPSRTEVWHQDTSGIQGGCELGDLFGASLATGNFDGQYNDDLAIGIPGENDESGYVAVLYSNANGITATDQLWAQSSDGIPGGSEAFDRFGTSIGAGDINNDGYDDIIIGVPLEDLSSSGTNYYDAGCINTILGSSSGLTSTGAQLISRNTSGIYGSLRSYTTFGWTIATGYFNTGNYTDVFLGMPLDNLEGSNAGTAHLIYGGTNGLSTTNILFTY